MKVLVCQKSNCCKRGGKAVMKKLKKLAEDSGLDGKVAVKSTGCMGKCSKGPVMLVGKTRHCKVKAGKVKSIVERHLRDRA